MLFAGEIEAEKTFINRSSGKMPFCHPERNAGSWQHRLSSLCRLCNQKDVILQSLRSFSMTDMETFARGSIALDIFTVKN